MDRPRKPGVSHGVSSIVRLARCGLSTCVTDVSRSQVHSRHAADQVRQAQKQPAGVADHRAGVGHQRGDRQPHRAGPEQHAGPDAGPMPVLQLEFHHLLVAVVVLHTVHHHGVPLLEHIQGE